MFLAISVYDLIFALNPSPPPHNLTIREPDHPGPDVSVPGARCVTIGIVCHGIPSLASGIAQEYVLRTPVRYHGAVIVPGNSNDRILIKAFTR